MKRLWSPADDALLRELYPHMPAKALGERLGRNVHAIYKRCWHLNLSKSPEFLASVASGRLMPGEHRSEATQFRPGNKPWTLGRLGVRMSRQSEFKLGSVPHNHMPVGTVVMATIGYLKIKIAEPKVWALLHRHNWEQAHGPIPAGFNLRFIDGDRRNCALANLELLERAEMMRRNSIHTMPPELRELSRLKGVLNRTITQREKADGQPNR